MGWCRQLAAAAAVVLACSWGWPGAVLAQTPAQGSVGSGGAGIEAGSPILTIDPERLFSDAAFGLRVQRDIEARAAELAAENRRIEADLIAEERDLTERRPTLAVDEFRALASAFDTKVERIRTEQDAKTRDLQRLRDMEQQRFFRLIGPVLTDILEERGAVIVLDRRNVFIASEAADITDAAIARIDAEIGDGADGDRN